MQRQTLDKLTQRARKSLKRATRAALDATTERAMKRHERRACEARKAMRRLTYDAFHYGEDFSDA